MGMVVLAIVIVRMAAVTLGDLVAKSVVGAIVVEVCRVNGSVLCLCMRLEEWRTDDGLSVLG